MALKVIYAGTPDFSVPALQRIDQSPHRVAAVYSQPDRKSGRGKKMTSSPVKNYAVANHLPIYQPESLRDETALQQMQNLKADIMVVAAYGLILPQKVIDMFDYGCINIHASLLPRWRGAAPIQRAIEMGDTKTGITIMQMDAGLDTGDILLQRSCEISSTMTTTELHDELMLLGGELIVEALEKIEEGTIQRRGQNDQESTYAGKLTKQESAIDWTQSAVQIDRKIRAFNPWPGTTAIRKEKAFKIIEAAIEHNMQGAPGAVIKHDSTGLYVGCGEKVLKITELQLPGKNKISSAQLFNAQNWQGEQLG